MSDPEWEVEVTDEFEEWWDSLSGEEQEDINAVVTVLQQVGGGDKTGHKNWYKAFVPRADALYDEHLDTLKREGLI